MIPRDYITEWRTEAPWVQDFQVEQDLIVSKALVNMFSNPILSKALAFRGGTALYKLYVKPAARYSEDIDLVQINPEPAGPAMKAVRKVLDPWLGEPRWKQTEGRVTFVYRFNSEDASPLPLRLKVEINSREHRAVYGVTHVDFPVSSRWFEGACRISTYALDELLATKLRALYQRSKGRDLFDLAVALAHPDANAARVVAAFREYMDMGHHRITRALFERNLSGKLRDPDFGADVGPLLAGAYKWDIDAAAHTVFSLLIRLLPGEPWKGLKTQPLSSR
jgi:predicted nucleotidyltransferase component of viral defense system